MALRLVLAAAVAALTLGLVVRSDAAILAASLGFGAVGVVRLVFDDAWERAMDPSVAEETESAAPGHPDFYHRFRGIVLISLGFALLVCGLRLI